MIAHSCFVYVHTVPQFKHFSLHRYFSECNHISHFISLKYLRITGIAGILKFAVLFYTEEYKNEIDVRKLTNTVSTNEVTELKYIQNEQRRGNKKKIYLMLEKLIYYTSFKITTENGKIV